MQKRTQGSGLVGGPDGILELAQDLGFPKHHGIQATGHAKSVPNGIVAIMQVDVGL